MAVRFVFSDLNLLFPLICSLSPHVVVNTHHDVKTKLALLKDFEYLQYTSIFGVVVSLCPLSIDRILATFVAFLAVWLRAQIKVA
jgi:hypothetical protein